MHSLRLAISSTTLRLSLNGISNEAFNDKLRDDNNYYSLPPKEIVEKFYIENILKKPFIERKENLQLECYYHLKKHPLISIILDVN